MTNYYKVLNLDPTTSAAEINLALDRLEVNCRKVEAKYPDKAPKMLAAIREARIVFHTDETKKMFDALFGIIPEDRQTAAALPAADARTRYDELMQSIISFRDSKQWDLAAIPLEEILSLERSAGLSKEEKRLLYTRALQIYLGNEQYAQALDMANRAIVTDPEYLNCYKNKWNVLCCTIDDLKQRSGSVDTKSLENYRNFCGVWARKAVEQNDNAQASVALSELGASYINYEPHDYELAGYYANESRKYDPQSKVALDILNWLDRQNAVTPQEVDRYRWQISPFVNEINSLAGFIANSLLVPDHPEGWLLTTKYFNGHYNPNKDGCAEDVNRTYQFFLSPDGKFIRKETVYRRLWRQGEQPSETTDVTVVEVVQDLLMLETDFSCYFSYSSEGELEWEEYGDTLGSYREYMHKGSLVITGRSGQKGEALLKKLKAIALSSK